MPSYTQRQDEPETWRDPNQIKAINAPGDCPSVDGVKEDSINHGVRFPVQNISDLGHEHS